MKGNELMTLVVANALRGLARRYQRMSGCQGPRGGEQGTWSLRGLLQGFSPPLPRTCACHAAGASPLRVYGIINTDQCSPEGLALTGQRYCWSLSIARQIAMTPEGLGKSIGSCRGEVPWVPGRCLVLSGAGVN